VLRVSWLACVLTFIAVSASAQGPPASVAIEADVLAYGLPGYSGILNVSLPSGFQVAVGAGRYRVPSFLLSGDANYDAVEWTATSTSIQVVRATYRFKGPMTNGLAVGLVLLNQNMRLRAERLLGETKFSELSVGPTVGYYQHVGKHFYLYPTAAYTRNHVHSGVTTLQGVPYTVEQWSPNVSLHAGWDWEWNRR
jgi:hypothetical protein